MIEYKLSRWDIQPKILGNPAQIGSKGGANKPASIYLRLRSG